MSILNDDEPAPAPGIEQDMWDVFHGNGSKDPLYQPSVFSIKSWSDRETMRALRRVIQHFIEDR